MSNEPFEAGNEPFARPNAAFSVGNEPFPGATDAFSVGNEALERPNATFREAKGPFRAQNRLLQKKRLKYAEHGENALETNARCVWCLVQDIWDASIPPTTIQRDKRRRDIRSEQDLQTFNNAVDEMNHRYGYE